MPDPLEKITLEVSLHNRDEMSCVTDEYLWSRSGSVNYINKRGYKDDPNISDHTLLDEPSGSRGEVFQSRIGSTRRHYRVREGHRLSSS